MHLLANIIKATVRMAGIFLGVCVAIVLLPPIVMMLLGYKVNTLSDELARKLVDGQKSPQACMKIINYGLLGPSSGESRAHCVKRYAEYAKDPSACELLMPSSYGLSCVGGAIEARRTCNVMTDTVSWWEDEKNDVVGRVTLASCQADDASGTEKRNQCCLIARVTRVRSENDCSSLSSDKALHDECLAAQAFKNRDVSTCQEIQDINLRSACAVRANAMKEDPSICSGCIQPIENLEDLR